jgi:N-acyl-D-amino-acid deacylase
MGYRSGRASAEELDTMKQVLQESLDAGAWGMSIGLIYAPGSFSDRNELIELLKVVARKGVVHHAHIRGQGETLIAAVQEAIDVSEAAGAPLHIHHHKGMGDANAPKVIITLAMIEEAISRGVRVSMDMYPYLAGQGGLAMFLPLWVHEGGSGKLIERLQDSALRQRIKREMLEPGLVPGYQSYVRDLGFTKCWDHVLICECKSDQYRHLAGKSISRAKPDWQDPFAFVFDLLIAEGGDVPVVIPDVIDLDDTYLQMVLRHPVSMFGSDGYALAPYGILGEGVPHPRSYGTFPRILGHYVRERKLFSWQEAIRKMTSMPAAYLGLTDRGVIAEGMWADILIFDPERIIDLATFVDPHQYSEGIAYVITNGTVVVEGPNHTGTLPGRVLRRG